MAIRYAVADGNWSNPATWDGSTLPAAGDDVRSNGFTVTIDGSYTCLTLSNKSETSPVVAAGGSFTLSAGVTLTATAGVIGGNALTTNAVNVSYASPGVSSIIGNCSGTDGRAVSMTGTGTLNITGDITNGNFASNRNGLAQSAGIVNIAGNVNGTGQVALALTGTAVCNITGNVTCNTVSSINAVTAASASLSIIGNVSGNSGTFQTHAIAHTGGNLTVIGTLSASASSSAIVSSSGGMCYFSGPFISSVTGFSAISCQKWSWIESPSGTYMEVRTSDLLAVRSLYTADYTSALHMPPIADVRSGTVYGPANELTGTCAVPPAGSVALGVPVDATTGTAALTQQAIADAVGPLIAAYGT